MQMFKLLSLTYIELIIERKYRLREILWAFLQIFWYRSLDLQNVHHLWDGEHFVNLRINTSKFEEKLQNSKQPNYIRASWSSGLIKNGKIVK